MRLFIAAPVTPSAALSEATTSLQDLFPGSRPVSGGSRHITLRFLGEVEKAQPVAAALRNALFGTAPVPAEVRGVGAFPQADAARIAWAAVDAPALDALVTRIWNATGKYGNRPEHSGFIPHITLARCRQARNITSWIDQ